MPSRPKLQWTVPSSEWEAFKDHVHSKHGEIKGYVGQEAENAMREWIDSDDYSEIEKRVDRLVRAAGRTPADRSQEKISTEAPGNDGDTTKVHTRVDADLKADFKSYVDEHTDDKVGIQLSKALRERRHGGRAGRLDDKLSRIEDDTEQLLEHFNDNDDSSIPKPEREAVAISHDLNNEFTRTDLHDTIEDVTGRDTEYIYDDRTERVLDRMDVTQHPNNPDLFVPEERAEQIDQTPAIDREEYADLSRSEKRDGIRIKLARAAKGNGGKGGIDVGEIQRGIFDGHPSDGHAQDLMRSAADAEGYQIDPKPRSDTNRLVVDLSEVSTDVLEAAGIEIDPSATDPDSNNGSEPDQKPNPEATMDQLMNARPVTDGGQDMSG